MELQINGIYKHFKGKYYIVLDVAYDSETNEKMLIYRALYDDNKLWVRPVVMFLEKVNKNGQKYRFELVDLQKM